MIDFISKFAKKNPFQISTILVLSMILPMVNNVIPKFTQQLIDKGILQKNFKFIVIISSSIIILYGIKYLFNSIIQSKMINLNLNTMNNIKKDSISSVVNSPMIFHDKNSSEYLLSRINEVDNLSSLFSIELITFIINIMSAIVAFICILNKSIIIALITMFLLPIFILIIKIQFKRISYQIQSSLESSAKTNEKMFSVIKGTQTLKQFNEENTLLNKLNDNIDELTQILITKNITINKNTNTIAFFTIAIQTILDCMVGIFITQNSLSIGDYFSISQYISLVYIPILSYQSVGMNIRPALISLRRLKDIKIKNESKNSQNILEHVNTIEVSNLCFQYDKNIPLIEDINFSLKKGDKILIKGPNGSGKSTLVKLFLGFYKNFSGNIFLDGIDLKSINEECIREKIAVVPQSCYLFDTSIIDNIKLANNNLTQVEFLKKIKYLQSIHLFDGIDLETNLIENGKNLSGGEVQRISLARILIRDFDVCIFDEFTNSLDLDSKKVLKKILKEEFEDKICIFISHDDYLGDLANKILYIRKNI